MTIRTRLTLLAISFSLAAGPAIAYAKPSDWANVIETDKSKKYSKYGNSSASAAAIAANDDAPTAKKGKAAKKAKAPKKAAKHGKAKRRH